MDKKKYNQIYTLGRVTGDAYMITGKNGKEYRLVPVTLLNGWHCNVFCREIPEVDSLALIRVVARENGLSYTLYSLGDKVKEFLQRACADVQA